MSERPAVILGQGDYARRWPDRIVSAVGTAPAPPVPMPSWIALMPRHEYDAGRAQYISYHRLQLFRRCPRTYYLTERDLMAGEPDTADYLVGRAAHTLILEGRDAYERGYALAPAGANARTKAYREWRSAQERDVLTESQAAMIEEMVASMLAHDAASRRLRNGIAEGVIRTRWRDVPMQARIDLISWRDREPQEVVEIKTCRNMDEFEPDIAAYEYVHQLACYRALIRAAGGPDDLGGAIIAVEKRPPYRTGVWTVCRDVLARAESHMAEAVDELRVCREADRWPTRYADERIIDDIPGCTPGR